MEQLKCLGIRRVAFIPNGADTSMFSPAKRSEELRESLLEGKDILIVNIGRLVLIDPTSGNSFQRSL